MKTFAKAMLMQKSDIKSVFPITIQIYRIQNDLSIVLTKKIRKNQIYS